MKKYNKSAIMTQAWYMYKHSTGSLTFGYCLGMAWNLAKGEKPAVAAPKPEKVRYEMAYWLYKKSWNNTVTVANSYNPDRKTIVVLIDAMDAKMESAAIAYSMGKGWIREVA